MGHTMANGQPCGRPDGHTGHHRSVDSIERRRFARREWDRKAWAKEQKYWQRHPVSRLHYDRARDMFYNSHVRNWQAIIATEQSLADDYGGPGPSQADFKDLEHAKIRGREMARRWYTRGRDNVAVVLGPHRFRYVPRDCMAAFDPRVDPATAMPYAAQDEELLAFRERIQERDRRSS